MSIVKTIIVKTIMLKSILCDYSDIYILVNGTITLIRAEADATAQQGDKRNKQVLSKNCAAFTGCISKINSRLTHNADLDFAMYTRYSDNSSKISGSLWQFADVSQMLL